MGLLPRTMKKNKMVSFFSVLLMSYGSWQTAFRCIIATLQRVMCVSESLIKALKSSLFPKY